MADYAAGHIKHNPEQIAVAIRTFAPAYDTSMTGQAWLVASPARGAYFLPTTDVEGWADLYVPPTPPAGS